MYCLHLPDYHCCIAEVKHSAISTGVVNATMPVDTGNEVVAMDIKKRVGHRIRALRKAQGLSMDGLAKRLAGEGEKLNPKYLGAVERGEVNISLASIAKISRALRVDPIELFRDVEKELEEDLAAVREMVAGLASQGDPAKVRALSQFLETLARLSM